jgi:hypothetical protein
LGFEWRQDAAQYVATWTEQLEELLIQRKRPIFAVSTDGFI